MCSLDCPKFCFVLRICQHLLNDVRFLCMPDITAEYHGTVFALVSPQFFICVSLVAYLASPNTVISKLLIDRIYRFWAMGSQGSVKEADWWIAFSSLKIQILSFSSFFIKVKDTFLVFDSLAMLVPVLWWQRRGAQRPERQRCPGGEIGMCSFCITYVKRKKTLT